MSQGSPITIIMVVTDFDTKPQTLQEKPRKLFRFAKANWDEIKSKLDSVAQAISELYNSDHGVEDLWSTFKE